MSRTTAAVALGSGGARGYAHIGVLEVLAERNYDIVAVSGSSMGALIGGLHAVGRLQQYTDWVTGLSQFDVMRLMDVSLTAPGMIRAEKILEKVREILGEVRIENLPIPYTAVATDLTTGRAQWFQRGPLDTAIRASIAIPGVITPFVQDGRVLVDGGILHPMPVSPLAAAPADVIVGVDLGADVDLPGLDGAPIDRAVAETSPSDTDRGHDVSGRKFGRLAVVNRSLDIMQEALARHQLAAMPPDVLVQIPRTSIGSLDFHRAQEMIEIGRAHTVRALDGHTPSAVAAFERPHGLRGFRQ